MRLFLKYLLVIACLYTLSACNKRLDNYDLEYSGDRLVVFGNISNEAGVTVYLTHTLPPTGTYYLDEIDVNVSDAIITLIENDLTVDTLVETSPGFYVASWLPTAGNVYSINVVADGFEAVYSENVVFPQPVNLEEVVYETGFENINGDPAFSVNPVFTDNMNEDNYYCFGFKLFVGEETYTGNIFVSPDNDALGCNAGRLIFNQRSHFIYSDNCFPGNTFPFSFIGAKVEHVGEIIPYDKCEFSVGAVSKELIDYASNISETAGSQLLLSDPKLNYTNITNGFGVFWAQNDTTFIYNF